MIPDERTAQPRRGRDRAMLFYGAAIGRDLVSRGTYEIDDLRGWRGALQSAASLTQSDPHILRVADEFYVNASQLLTRDAVIAHADQILLTVPDGAARWLLHGVIECLAESDALSAD